MERINMPYHVVRISAFCKKDFTAIIQSLETARQQVEPYWFNAKLMMMPTQTVGLSIYIQILATGVLGGDRLNTKALKKWKPVEVSIIRHRAIDVVMHGLRLGTHKQVSAI